MTTLLSFIDEGIPFRADPLPLTVLGELIAASNGRATFKFETGMKYCIYRNESRMRDKPRPPVVAQHRCYEPLIEHIDEHWAKHVSEVLQRMLTAKQVVAAENETEENALIRLNEVLGARVIENDRPPF